MAITTIQFTTLSDLFDFYNDALFAGNLPECLVNLSRHKGAHGFFAPESWKSAKDTKAIHEISLNPDTINRPDKAWHSTLVHEMVHLWQQVCGKPSRKCYHNQEWATKMEEVGLMPSNTGMPEGKRIGQSMTHYIMEDGAFDHAFEQISKQDLKNLKLHLVPNINYVGINDNEEDKEGEKGEEEVSKNGVKIKYTCSCDFSVWGKPGLKLKCCECENDYVEQRKKKR